MKRFGFIFMLASVMCLLPIGVSALTNNNGVTIPDEDYEILVSMYDETYVMNMTQEKYDKLSSYDLEFTEIATTYVETTYNSSLGLVTNKEITEEEFANVQATAYGDSVSSTSKKVVLSVVKDDQSILVTLYAVWSASPKTRSYDVIGIRFYGNMYMLSTAISGEQNYVDSDGDYHSINYAYNGTNTQRFTNGYGTSMNLVDQDVSYLSLLTESEFYLSGTSATIYGSYQHATSSLTLAKSQSYTLSGTGLGGVFEFSSSSISTKYDGMAGVYVIL